MPGFHKAQTPDYDCAAVCVIVRPGSPVAVRITGTRRWSKSIDQSSCNVFFFLFVVWTFWRVRSPFKIPPSIVNRANLVERIWVWWTRSILLGNLSSTIDEIMITKIAENLFQTAPVPAKRMHGGIILPKKVTKCWHFSTNFEEIKSSSNSCLAYNNKIFENFDHPQSHCESHQ